MVSDPNLDSSHVIGLNSLAVAILVLEIPRYGSVSGGEALHGSDSEDYPEHADEDEPEDAIGVVFLLNSWEHVSFRICWLADGIDVDTSKDPPDKHGNGKQEGDDRAPDDSAVLGDELARNLNHCGSDADAFPETAHAHDPSHSEDTGDGSQSSGVFVFIRALRLVLELQGKESSQKDAKSEHSEHRAVDHEFGRPLQKVEKEHGDNEGNESRGQDDRPSLHQVYDVP